MDPGAGLIAMVRLSERDVKDGKLWSVRLLSVETFIQRAGQCLQFKAHEVV